MRTPGGLRRCRGSTVPTLTDSGSIMSFAPRIRPASQTVLQQGCILSWLPAQKCETSGQVFSSEVWSLGKDVSTKARPVRVKSAHKCLPRLPMPEESARTILSNSDDRFRNDGKWM